MLLHCWWECKLIQPLWKKVWRFLKELGIKPPYDMTQQSHPQACTLREPGLKKALVSHCSLQHCLQQCQMPIATTQMPIDRGWIKKSWYICTTAYFSVVERGALESVLMRWMDLEPIIQTEVSQKDKDKYRILPHIYRIQKNSAEEFIYRAAIEKQTQRIDLWTWGERRRG